MIRKTLAFDVYGTLIDTSEVFSSLQNLVGEKAAALTELWRTKQLEYSFRRGLMQNYVDFATCTRQALDYSCLNLHVELTEEQRNALLAEYRSLPAFADATPGLELCRDSGYSLYAFSNGRADDVRHLLEQADIAKYFQGVVSCDEVKSFKPNPGVYGHFLRRAGCGGHEAWMVSGNPFDVIGALSAGMNAAWVKRSLQALFDPWEMTPTVTVSSLTELAEKLKE